VKRLLSHLAARGDISYLSLHFAEFIAARAQVDCDDLISLSAALVCEANQQGSVCIDLADLGGQLLFTSSSIDATQIPLAPGTPDWRTHLLACTLVGTAGVRAPLTLEGDKLYLNRFWHYEDSIASRIRQLAESQSRAEALVDSDRLNQQPDDLELIDNEQRAAVRVAAEKAFCVISGGPGSGKTSTVVRILSMLLRLQPNTRIALTAPTGKAAARMMASIAERIDQLTAHPSVRQAIPTEARTIHRLLGYRRHGFEYNENHPLPFDCVIVDEASMVDLKLMYHLLSALPETARLILLGDRDQLASVAAGNVLGDITGHGQDMSTGDGDITACIALLRNNYRFDKNTAIGELAMLVNQGQSDLALELLRQNQRGLSWFEGATLQPGANELEWLYEAYQPIFNSRTPAEALDCYDSTRVLCATNRGPLGVQSLNRTISNALLERNGLADNEHYHGLPVMINRNQYELGLYNGDTGILWQHETGLRACFRDSQNGIRDFALNRLRDFTPAWSCTVHKSQGSEFDNVLLILPVEAESDVLCRELLYTAVTRARRNFVLHGQSAVVRQAIGKLTRRFSGLAQKLGWPR